MARLKFTLEADMADLYEWQSNSYIDDQTPTLLSLWTTFAYTVEYSGYRFTYNGLQVVNGTVTNVREYHGAGSLFYTLSDGLYSLSTVVNLMANGYIKGLWSYLLNGDDYIYGSVYTDTILGYGGNDTLNGGLDLDTMLGGDGSDTYYIDNIGDVVTETNAIASTGGTDLVNNYLAAYTLGTNVENGRIMATTAANMTGNALNNVIYAGVGNNSMDGSTGSDSVDYVYATSAVAVNLTVTTAQVTNGSGSDTLLNVENLNGSNFNDVLTGNAAANKLNGGSGLDTLIGGLGNDSYYVDNTGDVVTESSVLLTEIDTVYSAITYTLGANIETLILTGTAANGTGNSLANTLTGNAAANKLNGGSGLDTLIGGLGNDSYYVDNTGDVVTESSVLLTEIDTVYSAITYTLGANIETLILTGTAANGTGNSLANTLTGNAAANILSGLAGNDSLNGGLGADKLTGGKGQDNLTGGAGRDTFTFAAGDDGITAATLDKILDYAKGAVGTGDLIDYSVNLTKGGNANIATASQASINQSTGIATFANGSGTTLADALNDITARFTAATNTAGELACFKINNTGVYYLFVSDGTAGAGVNDDVIQLVGVTSISGINLTSGNLTITG